MNPADPTDAVDWLDLSRRLAYASHRLIGWIFWDPGGIARFEALGVPNGLGYYIVTRAAPLAPAGHQAVTAAFGSIHPDYVRFSLDHALAHTSAEAVFEARNAAVDEGLRQFVPEVAERLDAFADELWAAVDALPSAGRVLFAAHRQAPRPTEPSAVSTWLALNAIREWRGDMHWMLQVAAGWSMTAAMVLDAAWRGYDGDWLPRSRGADDAALAAAIAELTTAGLMTDGVVNDAGHAARQAAEDRLDALTMQPWQHLGAARCDELHQVIDAAGERLMARVDNTAGPLWMPAGRPRKERT